MILNGTNGNDTINAIVSATSAAVDVVTVDALQPVNLPVVSTTSLAVDSLLGNDILTVDSTNGGVLIPITYDGGPGSNALRFQQGTAATAATSDVYTPGSQLGSGTNTLMFAGSPETVHFLNLAPVFDAVPSPVLIVNASAAANSITYSDGFDTLANFLNGTPVPTWGQVAVDNLEPMEFQNKANLIINGLGGNDTINLNNPFNPTGLTAIGVSGGQAGGVANGRATVVVSAETGARAGANSIAVSYGLGTPVIPGFGSTTPTTDEATVTGAACAGRGRSGGAVDHRWQQPRQQLID